MKANPASFACAREDGSAFSTSAEAPETVQTGRVVPPGCVQNATPVNRIEPDVKPEGAFVQPVRLVLPYPISENRYWATRVIRVKATGKWMAMTYVTPEAKAYRQQVGLLALQAGVRKPITGRTLITLDLYPHRPLDWAKRARKDPDGWADTVQCIDLGNSEKVLCDALNSIAWLDDKQLWDIHKRKHEPDEHGARVVVTITPIVRQPIAPELF